MGQCHSSTLVSAPAEEVWSAISDFHSVSWAPEYTTKDDAAGQEFCDPIYHALLKELDTKFT